MKPLPSPLLRLLIPPAGLALLLTTALAVPVGAAPAGDCVVEILSTTRAYDPSIPWRREKPRVDRGYGVVVGPGRVLTVESLVRSASLIELRRAGSGTRIPATLVQADPQANLALLQFADDRDTAGLAPVNLAAKVPRDSRFRITQFDEAGQIQSAEAMLSEVGVRTLPAAPWRALTLSLQSDLHAEGAGTPVFLDGELAGLVMDYDTGTRSSTVLPSSLMAKFLDDVRTPPYAGVASAGFTWTPLLSPDKRRYLGLPDEGQGILVLQTIPGSGVDGVLQPQDVIEDWDGFALDSEGYYQDPEWGRLQFANLIGGRRSPGDEIKVRVRRACKPTELTVRLQARTDDDAYIPENAANEPVDYIVEAGMVIRELTGDYLRAPGARWMLAMNSKFVRLYLTRAQFPEKPGDRVVVLAGVLPDPIGVGYLHLRDQIITAVNGKPVRNLEDVFAIAEKDGVIERLSLQGQGIDVLLPRDGIADANRRLQSSYSIPRLRYRRPKVSRLPRS